MNRRIPSLFFVSILTTVVASTQCDRAPTDGETSSPSVQTGEEDENHTVVDPSRSFEEWVTEKKETPPGYDVPVDPEAMIRVIMEGGDGAEAGRAFLIRFGGERPEPYVDAILATVPGSFADQVRVNQNRTIMGRMLLEALDHDVARAAMSRWAVDLADPLVLGGTEPFPEDEYIRQCRFAMVSMLARMEDHRDDHLVATLLEHLIEYNSRTRVAAVHYFAACCPGDPEIITALQHAAVQLGDWHLLSNRQTLEAIGFPVPDPVPQIPEGQQ